MTIYPDSFIYLWHDSNANMFYLGVHKGTPDDSYTHSSRVMESFTKSNIPPGFRRRILCRGTREEMGKLETSLLENRKKKKWHKYYNVAVGMPDITGEKNGMYGVKLVGELNHAYGGPGTFKGKKHSAETKAKMAEAARKRGGSHMVGELNPMAGKTHSEETRAKMKAAWVKRRLRKQIL